MPAAKADQDHRIGYALGGPTIEANLSAPCRHDHRLKDEAHWHLSAPRPGLTIWTSPLGRRYESRPPPAIPRPAKARTFQPGWAPPGGPTSQLDGCGCIIAPCPHDEEESTATTATEAKHIADTAQAAAEPDILDDGKPPF